MKRILSVVCCIALCSIAVLAQKKAMGGPAMSDQQFVDFAAQTDMVEANLGQLSADASSSQPVKDYGQMLVTDHTSDFAQLHVVAQQAGLTVPDAIDAEHNKAMIAPFQKLKGAAGRREDAFQKSVAAEKNQGNVLNRKFDELFQRAKEDPELLRLIIGYSMGVSAYEQLRNHMMRSTVPTWVWNKVRSAVGFAR